MLPSKYQKKSFLRLGHPIDTDRLVAEYESLDEAEWQSSYWGNVHCSIGMLLLRGGTSGTPEDFYGTDVEDQPVLSRLPYMCELIGDSGPFGRAEFAFLFRMEPNGVTLAHNDYMERWKDLYRIHVPIVTNKKAQLIANGHSQHLATGHAWTFNNQARHGVVNGPETRVHLIFDVPFSDAFAATYDRAKLFAGERNPANDKKIESQKKARQSYPGDVEISATIARLTAQGMDSVRIAQVFNDKKIPARRYDISQPRGASTWSPEDVDQLRAADS